MDAYRLGIQDQILNLKSVHILKCHVVCQHNHKSVKEILVGLIKSRFFLKYYFIKMTNIFSTKVKRLKFETGNTNRQIGCELVR